MSRRALFLFAALGLTWGIPYLLIKVAVAEVPVPVLVFARTSLAALLLSPVLLRPGTLPQLFRLWRPVLAFAAVEIVVPFGLLSHAETAITSSTAGLLVAATPILSVVLGRLSGLRLHLGRRQAVGLGVGLAGVFVLAAPQLTGQPLSIIEGLLAATCYAAGSLIAGRWLSEAPSVAVAAACLLVASVVYLPGAISTWPATVPSAGAITAVLVLATACTALAFVWFFALVREVGSTRSTVITYLNPAVAVLAGAVVLGELIDLVTVVAFALILTGSALSTMRPPARTNTARSNTTRKPIDRTPVPVRHHQHQEALS
jgi:drug/metabolite transporter (DMT)-like permease